MSEALKLPSCWLAPLVDAGPCDGPLDPAHLIPKQRIRRELTARGTEMAGPEFEDLPAVVWDPRVWRPICRRHHDLLDGRMVRVGRSQLPPEVEEYAAEHGLLWSLDRDYGEREAVA